MSVGSPVSTFPPGSARATTTASTAEPCFARYRRLAARRAVSSGRSVRMSHVLSSRLVLASGPGRPVTDSTTTTEGSYGRPSLLSARTPIRRLRGWGGDADQRLWIDGARGEVAACGSLRRPGVPLDELRRRRAGSPRVDLVALHRDIDASADPSLGVARRPTSASPRIVAIISARVPAILFARTPAVQGRGMDQGPPTVTVRPESPHDHEARSGVVAAAFGIRRGGARAPWIASRCLTRVRGRPRRSVAEVGGEVVGPA